MRYSPYSQNAHLCDENIFIILVSDTLHWLLQSLPKNRPTIDRALPINRAYFLVRKKTINRASIFLMIFLEIFLFLSIFDLPNLHKKVIWVRSAFDWSMQWHVGSRRRNASEWLNQNADFTRITCLYKFEQFENKSRVYKIWPYSKIIPHIGGLAMAWPNAADENYAAWYDLIITAPWTNISHQAEIIGLRLIEQSPNFGQDLGQGRKMETVILDGNTCRMAHS